MNDVIARELTLSFSDDMPAASVEIVDGELRRVGAAVVRNGHTRHVELTGGARFIRIHMPDGRLVTLPVSGDEICVSREMVDPAFNRRPPQRRFTDPVFTPLAGGAGRTAAEMSAAVFEERPRRHQQQVWEWLLEGGKRVGDELQWVFAGESARAFDLIGIFGRSRIQVRIPGNVRKVEVDSAVTWPGPLALKVRLNSRTSLLNMLTGFLQHADMIGTTDAIRDLLSGGAPKIADPFAGCVLGYLLLRLRRFDDAALQVFRAAEESQTPDGAVITAWVTLARTPERVHDIEAQLACAVERGIPTYTEGTRLLIDGLIALEKNGAQLLERARKMIGHVTWRAPVTTMLFQADSSILLPRVSVAFQG